VSGRACRLCSAPKPRWITLDRTIAVVWFCDACAERLARRNNVMGTRRGRVTLRAVR
jgi:ribosomal protein L37AE/L43A